MPILVASRVAITPCVVLTTLLRSLSPKRSKSFLLSVSIDIRSNDECNDVEEWDPGFLRQKLLGEGQSNRRCNPADPHDRHKTGSDGSTNLMECACPGDDSHGD